MKLRHYLSILLALAVLAGAAGTVYLQDAREFGDMEVRALAGSVSIQRGNEVVPVGTSPESLEPQDVVVTGKSGLAELNLEGGRTVALQRSTRLRVRSESVVEAQRGSVVAAVDGASMQVLFDDVTARVAAGQFRLDRGFGSARAAAYQGRVRLESAGEPRVELTRLMQVDVAAGDLPEDAIPYRLDLRDAWDQAYLADVVDLTQDLDLLAQGFARQVGAARPGLDYFSDLAGAKVGFMQRYLSRSVADLLVAFTIAENDPNHSRKASFEQAFAFFDEGASYGVAAAILDVKGSSLVAQLERLIVGTGAVAADGGAGDTTFGLASGPASSGSDPGSSGTTDPSDEEVVSGGVDGGTVENVDDCGNVVDCGVKNVQDQLPPGPAPKPAPEEEEDPDDLLSGGDSLLGGGGGLLGGNK